MKVTVSGRLVGGVGGSGVYVDAAQVRAPWAGTATAGGERVFYQGTDALLHSCALDGSDDETPECPSGITLIVASATVWAAWTTGTVTVTSWGESFPGWVPMLATDDGGVLLMSYPDPSAGLRMVSASGEVWADATARGNMMYPYPQAAALDKGRVLWVEPGGAIKARGLGAVAQVAPVFDPFLMEAPDGRVWLGYHNSDCRVHPLDDASRGYIVATGNTFGTSAAGSTVGWALDQGESQLRSAVVDWSAPLVALGGAPVPAPVPVPPAGPVPPVAPLLRKAWVTGIFMKSLRVSIDNIAVPFGNALTLVGAGTRSDGTEIDPDMIRREIDQFGHMALVVADTSAESDPTANLNLTVAWWVSGRDMDDLGTATRRALSRPEKPVVAYLDRRGWPAARPAWVTEQVWPSLMCYPDKGESPAAFEAAMRRECDTLASYGRPFWLTLRLDDWNGSMTEDEMVTFLPVYDRLMRDYFVVGVHGFSWGRGNGMNKLHRLAEWFRRVADATERPNRFDYWTSASMTPAQSIGAKVAQNVAWYAFTPPELAVLRAAFPYGPAPSPVPPPPPPPPTPDAFPTDADLISAMREAKAHYEAQGVRFKTVEEAQRDNYTHFTDEDKRASAQVVRRGGRTLARRFPGRVFLEHYDGGSGVLLPDAKVKIAYQILLLLQLDGTMTSNQVMRSGVEPDSAWHPPTPQHPESKMRADRVDPFTVDLV